MGHFIQAVEDGSIAYQLGLKTGDELIKMNGESVVDWVDYQALSSEEKINLVVKRNGEELEFEFEKDDYEPLGLTFESDMLSGIRNCANKCMFCFVDQLPKGCRESMYVKDDDWRLSLMMGNYVTLTNVGDKELDRIIRRGATPLYVSVHSTNPDLRRKLLGNEKAGNIMEQLNKLADGGIQFHAQLVLCPGINDGEELIRTIGDLTELYPACLSLALVPVGLTKFRDGLDEIKPYTKEEAKKVLEIAKDARKFCLREFDTRFVFPADEFYQIAGEDVPSDSEYEDYQQIDNGVGLIRQLIQEFSDAYELLPPKYKKIGKAARKITVATGVSAQPVLKKLMNDYPISGVDVTVQAIKNRFFGESVTVAGLVTGNDLINQLKASKCDAIMITECMLRSEGDRFLDDVTLTEASRALGKAIIPIGRTGEDLLDALVRQSNVK
ncbi:MAG: DUF512 domain-containing protein [Clostridia bacterium]|nr:DUF512 domain-containing protein [Clostridia bacterium]